MGNLMSIEEPDKVLANIEITDDLLQLRRLELLRKLEQRIMQTQQAEILRDLKRDKSAAFIMSHPAVVAIRRGLQDKRRHKNESAALGHLSVAAQTPDATGIVYQLDAFTFENIGEADYVMAVERDTLDVGEVEIHTHVYSRPMYLDNIDIADVVSAVAGPSWIDPYDAAVSHGHRRVFGIMSLHWHGLARLQFYCHNLLDDLTIANNYGLKKLGNPVVVPNAF
jgi:hypothetical protein